MPSTESCFRLKLEFESPPPGMPGSCKYMILVKTDICKTIYDLEQTVIRKFGFSKGATTTLALDGFVLVPMEDICILSNDDSILVTVHQETKEATNASSKKKRKLHNGNDTAVTKVTKSIRKRNQVLEMSKTTKKISSLRSTIASKKRKASTSCDSSSVEDERESQKSPLKLTSIGTAATKKPVTRPTKAVLKIFVKKPPASSHDFSDTSSDNKNSTTGKKHNKAAGSVDKPTVCIKNAIVTRPTKAVSKIFVKKSPASSHDSSDTSSDEKGSTTGIKQIKAAAASVVKPTVGIKNAIVTRPTKAISKIFVKKSPASSHDSSDTSSDDKNSTTVKKQIKAAASVVKPTVSIKNAIGPEKTVKEQRKKRTQLKSKRHTANSTKNSSANHITFDSSGSHSSGSDLEMETEATPVQNQEQPPSQSLNAWLKSSLKLDNKEHFQNRSSNFKDPGVSTNVSTVYENPTVVKDNPGKSDKIEKKERPSCVYTELLPSTWPPRVGDMIAYKLLEMSQDYTPIISGYKEAKVLEIFPSSTSPIGVDAVRMELLWQEEANTREGGKFEMDLGEDEDEPSDNEDLVVEWQSLLEPKRIQ